MSDNDNKSVRRFGQRDQKDRLPKPSSLFPPDDLPDERPPTPTEANEAGKRPPVDLDLDQLDLPEDDSEALAALGALRGEVKAPIITPRAERYPPIAPTNTTPPSHHMTQEAPATSSKTAQRGAGLYNLLTGVFLLGTVGVVVWFALIWIEPQSPLNPLPPPTPFVEMVVTPQDTLDNMPLTATPDEAGQIFVVITDTPAPTTVNTPSPFPFITAPVLYVPNSNEFGCNWWSIAGTVTDSTGEALDGYPVRIQGDGVDEIVFSGASQAFGAGGYELPLVGTPDEASFTVQLFSVQDAPLSPEVTVTTRADCGANITILNFIQNR
ncbi:MAG: hypothetical protein ACFE0Q_13155 [Anaerolineae bacterium]